MRMPYRCLVFSALTAFGGLADSRADAGGLPEHFTLGRYIPGDAWMLVNATSTQETAWVDGQVGKVFAALRDSGIDRDIVALILSLLGTDEQQAEVQASLDKVVALVKEVDWDGMFGREVAFAERVRPELPGVEYILLTRGLKGSAKPNAKTLAALLAELAMLTDELTLSNQNIGGVERWILDARSKDSAKGPKLKLQLLRKGDLLGIVVGSGGKRSDDILNLIVGHSEQRSIIDTPRFKSAIAQVETPEHFFIFFNAKLMGDQLRKLFSAAFERKQFSPGDEGPKVLAAVHTLLNMLNVLDFSVTSAEMKGQRELYHTVTRLRDSKRNTPVAKVVLNRKPFDRFDRYVPAEATGFELSANLDLEQAYALAIDFVDTHLPQGPQWIATWNATLTSIGFDPQRDVFSWWAGETIEITLPAMAGKSDSVLMIRVKDVELARAKIDAAVDFISKLLQDKNPTQAFTLVPASVKSEGFREIMFPALLMMGIRPVFGFTDEWLVVATSGKAVDKCLAVATGDAPSILKNPRFRDEGLIPSGLVRSVSFVDKSNYGNELGTALGIAGMVGQIAVAQIPAADEKTRRLKKVLQTAVSVAAKLSPVAGKLDFYGSESSLTVIDGTTIREERVIVYKNPANVSSPRSTEASDRSPQP